MERGRRRRGWMVECIVVLLWVGFGGVNANWSDEATAESSIGYVAHAQCSEVLLADDYLPATTQFPGRTDRSGKQVDTIPIGGDEDWEVEFIPGEEKKRVAVFNARSLFLAYFPASVTNPSARYARELAAGPRLDVLEPKTLPLQWSRLLTGLTGNFDELRLLCVWCDQAKFDGEKYFEQVPTRWLSRVGANASTCQGFDGAQGEKADGCLEERMGRVRSGGETRLAIIGTDHLLDRGHKLSAFVSIRNDTGVVQVVYRDLAMAHVDATFGKAGIQVSPFSGSGSAFTAPREWFLNDTCFPGGWQGSVPPGHVALPDRPDGAMVESLVVTYYRPGEGETVCSGVDCGEHGNCVDGLCECDSGYWGERCEQAPARVWIRAPPFHDGLADIPIEVALDREASLVRGKPWGNAWKVPMARNFMFRDGSEEHVLVDEARIQPMPYTALTPVLFGIDTFTNSLSLNPTQLAALQATTSTRFLIHLPTNKTNPGDVHIHIPENALFHSVESNHIVVQFRPVVTLECADPNAVGPARPGDYASGKGMPVKSALVWDGIPSALREEAMRGEGGVGGRLTSPLGLPMRAVLDIPRRIPNASLDSFASESFAAVSAGLGYTAYVPGVDVEDWNRPPPVSQVEQTCFFDGFHAISIRVFVSAPIHTLGRPSHAVEVVEGDGVVVDEPLTITESGDRFVFRVIPALNAPDAFSSDIVIRLPDNSTNQGLSWPSNTIRLKFAPRPKRFVPSGRPFDERGVVYWLGTRYGTDSWRNPADPKCLRRGEAQVLASVASSAALDRLNGAWGLGADGRVCLRATRTSNITTEDNDWCITSRDPRSVCFTAPELNQAWEVDFGAAIAFRPTAYALRDGEDALDGMLRNWVLEGTNDFRLWSSIDEHKNDLTLTNPQRSAVFHITPKTFFRSYRAFRIRQTGPNSRGAHYLNLAGLELYGTLFHPGDPCAQIECGSHGMCRYGTPRSVGAYERDNRERNGVGGTWNPRSHATPHSTVSSATLSSFRDPTVGVVQAGPSWHGTYAPQTAYCECAGGWAGPVCTISPKQRRTSYTFSRSLDAILLTDDQNAPTPTTKEEMEVIASLEKKSLIAAGLIGALRRGEIEHYEERSTNREMASVETFWWPLGGEGNGSACIAGHFRSVCHAAAGRGSYWGLHLPDFVIKLTGYAIRDGSSAISRTMPRSWRLEILRSWGMRLEDGSLGFPSPLQGYPRPSLDSIFSTSSSSSSSSSIPTSYFPHQVPRSYPNPTDIFPPMCVGLCSDVPSVALEQAISLLTPYLATTNISNLAPEVLASIVSKSKSQWSMVDPEGLATQFESKGAQVGGGVEVRRAEGEWMVVDSHIADTDTLTFPGAIAGIRLRKTPPTNLVRLVHTGPNGEGGNEMWVSGLELYGDVFVRGDPCAHMDCGPHGKCAGGGDGEGVWCNCDATFTGEFCQLPRYQAEEDTARYPVDRTGELLLGATLTLLTIVVLFLIVRIGFAKVPSNISTEFAIELGIIGEEEDEEDLLSDSDGEEDGSGDVGSGSGSFTKRKRRTMFERAHKRMLERDAVIQRHRFCANRYFPCCISCCECCGRMSADCQGLTRVEGARGTVRIEPTPRREPEAWERDPVIEQLREARDKGVGIRGELPDKVSGDLRGRKGRKVVLVKSASSGSEGDGMGSEEMKKEM